MFGFPAITGIFFTISVTIGRYRFGPRLGIVVTVSRVIMHMQEENSNICIYGVNYLGNLKRILEINLTFN